MSNRTNNRGYIALTTVLVITVLVLVIGVSTSLLTVNDMQSSYSYYKSEGVLSFVEACAEDALMRLNKNGSIPATLVLPTLPTETCSVTINSQVGSDWDFTVSSGDVDGYLKKIRIIAEKTTTVSIASWKEEI